MTRDATALGISALFVYPLKGAGGIRLDAARLDRFGVHLDRRWVLTDPAGDFLSQRNHPRMALIRCTIEGKGLRFDAPDVHPLRVAAEPDGGEARRVRVWHDLVDATLPSPEADGWFSGVLDSPCRAAFFPAHAVRPVDPEAAPGAVVGFADAFPLLVLTQASVDELNRRLERPVPVDRFRPNVVIGGDVPPHAEDRWRRLAVGALRLRLVKPCARCAVTTVDQATGVRGKEPLRTLAEYRRHDGQLYFGQNAIHESPGVLRRGDRVRVLDSGMGRPF